jgi:hypothetical protein
MQSLNKSKTSNGRVSEVVPTISSILSGGQVFPKATELTLGHASSSYIDHFNCRYR